MIGVRPRHGPRFPACRFEDDNEGEDENELQIEDYRLPLTSDFSNLTLDT